MSFRSFLRATPLFAFAACLAGTDITTPANVPIESTNFAPALGVNLLASVKTPSGMYYRDITVGTGTTLAAGQQVGMYYTLHLANGVSIQTLAAPSTPYSFRIAATPPQVIPGWDEGVVGMKVGGKRQLIIPPALGYGSQPNGPIPGNAVLVFTVDAVSAQ